MSDRKPLQNKVHPVWRGIGCLMMLLIPIIAFGLSDILLGYLLEVSPELVAALDRAGHPLNWLLLQIGATIMLSVMLYLLFSIISSIVYRLLGGFENDEIASRIGTGRRRY